MKKRLSMVFMVLSLLVLSSVIILAQQRPDGISYIVTFTDEEGVPEFEDCWIFGTDGILTIGVAIGLNDPMIFEQNNHGESKVFWSAVGVELGLAFSGMSTGNSNHGMLSGNGLNNLGWTYVFRGYPADCGGDEAFLSTQSQFSDFYSRSFPKR